MSNYPKCPDCASPLEGAAHVPEISNIPEWYCRRCEERKNPRDPVAPAGPMKAWWLRINPEFLSSQWWDKCEAMVVMAKSKEHARALAGAAALDEGPSIWTSPAKSTIKDLSEQTTPGVVLMHVREP